MQLQREHNPALNAITAYGDDYVAINFQRHDQSIFFAPDGPVQELAVQHAAQLTVEHLRAFVGLDKIKQDPMAFLDDAPPARPADAPELLLIGTGQRQHFLNPAITQELLQLGIGVEIMDTQAAARTYNILMAEGRKVVVALLIQEPA
ncbi:Mth938-like domain-containing protein [Alcaligenes sp. SDU_A2]|uniref:Mth938-like domain-containing protein n=1 Tax=Alcaligenes sp. SDU_A2 TaxID=3136634 RepID=UPI002B9A1825|nr:Mth938-like domain-containing protein [Alcaligenes sp.]HRL28565.1 Mth938-like domain-containing protein [Alcaligenes sp.]